MPLTILMLVGAILWPATHGNGFVVSGTVP